MKVTIDIPDNYIPLLSGWASVGRSFDTALECLDAVEAADGSVLADNLSIAEEELIALKNPLNCLHQLVRSEIWEAKRHA